MFEKIKNENGMAIVEATYVFPIIVIVVFLLIYIGNGYWQKCQLSRRFLKKSRKKEHPL